MKLAPKRSALLILAISLLWATLPADLQSRQRSISPAEAADIVRALEIGAGSVVADVGAGYGRWAVEMARTVTDEGQVYATEVDLDRLKDIRTNVTEAGLKNVSIIWGSQRDTGLPPECCDGILLRRVYHHFTDSEAMRTSLQRALRPDGVLLVIDFEPEARGRLKQLNGVPETRGGHGISKHLLLEEMSSSGFEVVREARPWHGKDFGILFRVKPRPEATDESNGTLGVS